MTQVRGRGPGRKENTRFSLAVPDPESTIGTIVLKIKGRDGDTLAEKHRKLLRMAQYCQLRHAYYRWYPAYLMSSNPERALYVRVPQRSIDTIKREAHRKCLSMEGRARVPYFPFVGPVSAPVVEEEEVVP